MSYQIIPNILFILAVLAILLMILRRLPAAAELDSQHPALTAAANLAEKGLPVVAWSRASSFLKFWLKRIWNFILEAKDLKPHAAAGYKMKKLFSRTQSAPAVNLPPVNRQEIKNEQYYLNLIKQDHKNLSNYDGLGKYYIEQQDYAEGRDTYLYLTSHQPQHADFHARLAYCLYQLKSFAQAAESYQKSLALDSTQPNRYYNLGLSQEAAGDLSGAIKSFEHAIASEPQVKYYVSLSNALYKAGQTQASKQALLTAQAKEPDNELVKNKLAKFI